MRYIHFLGKSWSFKCIVFFRAPIQMSEATAKQGLVGILSTWMMGQSG